jgi:3-phenylpropionate/trans-cinnamate dioxygenase ferredoxin component
LRHSRSNTRHVSRITRHGCLGGSGGASRAGVESCSAMTAGTPSEVRLIAVGELDDSQVTVVPDTPHGALAVGLSAGKPFAVSNRCRHLFASLGEGRVDEDGCLECPWHRALYDVSSGRMVRGPQGVFKPLAGAVRATAGARALGTFPVEIRDGAIWLTG